MSSWGSSSEDYELRRRHELLHDFDQRTFAGWVEEQRIMARHEDMDWSVEEKVKNTSANKEGQVAVGSRTREPTFVGSINTGRAFSHNMQGPIPPVPDLSSCPTAEEALQVTDDFCNKYRVLRMEVEILQEENNRLRMMLENFLTPIMIAPPPLKE
jgi:hypothetical protein